MVLDRGHLGRQYAGCAVERRERLVEHRHMPADRGLPLDKRDLLPGVGQRERSVDPRNPRTDDKHVGVDADVFRGKRAVVRHAPDGGPDEVERFVCRRVMVGAHPGDVLPDVHHLEKVRVEPSFFGGHAECMLVEKGRAGGDDDPVELVLADVGDDEFLTRV